MSQLMMNEGSANCFKCEKEVGTAMRGVNVWDAPCDATLFEGGFTYGSSMYDAGSDGIHVEMVICDDCLIESKKYLREMKKIVTPTRSIPANSELDG